jgi:hypothetical protein
MTNRPVILDTDTKDALNDAVRAAAVKQDVRITARDLSAEDFLRQAAVFTFMASEAASFAEAAVVLARKNGATWDSIADTLGVTRSAVIQRYAARVAQ